MRLAFPSPINSSTQWQRGKGSAKSIEASHPESLVLGLEGETALSHACHKHSGDEIPLALVHVCFSMILENRHLHASLSQLPCKSMETEARSELLMLTPGDTGSVRGGPR